MYHFEIYAPVAQCVILSHHTTVTTTQEFQFDSFLSLRKTIYFKPKKCRLIFSVLPSDGQLPLQRQVGTVLIFQRILDLLPLSF